MEKVVREGRITETVLLVKTGACRAMFRPTCRVEKWESLPAQIDFNGRSHLAITSFTGKHRFLSNFTDAPVELDGMSYRSVEHAYQAAKTISPDMRLIIQSAPTAAAAKALGKKVDLRDDWLSIRLDIMTNLVRQKFAPRSFFAEQLLKTGDEELVEGNWWGDKFWGKCNGEGENHLGKILMQVREELRGRDN